MKRKTKWRLSGRHEKDGVGSQAKLGGAEIRTASPLQALASRHELTICRLPYLSRTKRKRFMKGRWKAKEILCETALTILLGRRKVTWGGGGGITVTNMLSLQSLLVTTLLTFCYDRVTQVRMAVWRNFTDVLYTELVFWVVPVWLAGWVGTRPTRQDKTDLTKTRLKVGGVVVPRRRENLGTAHHRLMTNNSVSVGTISLAAGWRVTPTQ